MWKLETCYENYITRFSQQLRNDNLKIKNLKVVLAELKTLYTACWFHISILILDLVFSICLFVLLETAIGACLKII